MDLQGICQKTVPMSILPEMEYRMEIIYMHGFKVYYVNRYHIGQPAVIISLIQAAGKLPAPIEKAPPVQPPLL